MPLRDNQRQHGELPNLSAAELCFLVIKGRATRGLARPLAAARAAQAPVTAAAAGQASRRQDLLGPVNATPAVD
jgi:hypothetical protein